MRLALTAICVLAVTAAAPVGLRAQSLDRVRIGLLSQPGMEIAMWTWADPPPRRLGVFTLEPPVLPGEIIRLRLPVGELVSKAAHGIMAVNQRRREAAARRQVQKALSAFNAQANRVPD